MTKSWERRVFATHPDGSPELIQLWCEHNSSQSRSDDSLGRLDKGRDFVVLRDVADPDAVVAAFTP